MADDGPPPLKGGSGSEEDESESDENDSGSSQESSSDEEEEEEEDQEEEEESDGPPPMWGESGSEGEEELPAPPPKTSKKKGGASAAAGKKGGKANGKPPAAAGSSKKGKAAGGGGGAGKQPADSPLWKAFEKSRKGTDQSLGLPPLQHWRSVVKDIPVAFTSWYSGQVLRDESKRVPHLLAIDNLPKAFPEFCHWVAAGNHNSCDGQHLMAGFESLATRHVQQIEDAGKPARRTPPSPAPQGAASASTTSAAAAAGASTSGSGRGGTTAPVSEPISGGGGIDPKARKRDRRARKGGAAVNGTVNFAQKMQSALEGIDAVGDEGSAAARAVGAGQRAEDETRRLLRAEDVLEVGAGDALGPAFADSTLPIGTLSMLSNLKRAKEYRRRADRQQECLEKELERCLGRLARVEGQYLALVAETSGQEATLQSCLAKARSLIENASIAMAGPNTAAEQARGDYDDAIKLLEAHVEKAPQPGAGEAESVDNQLARQMLCIALCNRSAASYRLGDAYSGKRDAERAAAECPGTMAQEAVERSQQLQKTLSSASTTVASQWPVFTIPL